MGKTPTDKEARMIAMGITPGSMLNQETQIENDSIKITTSTSKKEDDVAKGFKNALKFNRKPKTSEQTKSDKDSTKTTDSIPEVIEKKTMLEEPEEVQVPKSSVEVKTPSKTPDNIKQPETPINKGLSTLYDKLSSLFSPKKKIDFENMEFTLDIFPENEGKGTTIAYKLKEHEAESFEELKLLLPTTQNSDTFKWIILTILNDYDTLIQEETKWKQEIENLTPAEIKSYVDMEKDDIRQLRLERMGLFTAPPLTRGKDVRLNITCQLGAPAMEKLNQLLSLLGENKRPYAIRWIMNAFVDDYGNFIHEKAEDEKYTNSLLYGEL